MNHEWPSFGETAQEQVLCGLLLLLMVLVPLCWVIGRYRTGSLFVVKSMAASVVFLIYLGLLWVAFVGILVVGLIAAPLILLQNRIGPKADKWLNYPHAVKLPVLFFLSVVCATAQPFYKATWAVPSNTTVAGYRVLMGKASGVYTATNSVAGRLNNTVTLSNAPAGIGYLVGIAYADDGTESMFSTPEVKWTNRAFAPLAFRLTGAIQAGLSPTGPWTNIADLNILMPPVPTNQTASFFRSTLLLKELP